MAPTVHASVVLIGARAVLIQGPSGSGKSRLALALLSAEHPVRLPFVRLVADDRVLLAAEHGRLLARSVPELAGLIEVRGLGVRRVPFEPLAMIGLVVELGLPQTDRLPSPASMSTEIAGIRLPRLAVAAGIDPLPLVLAQLGSVDGST